MTASNSKQIDVPYESNVEQCGSVLHGKYEYGGGVLPPSMHVGILPCNSLI